jgi:stearoyl-CoA desaturase (delta-9 desaturase)
VSTPDVAWSDAPLPSDSSDPGEGAPAGADSPAVDAPVAPELPGPTGWRAYVRVTSVLFGLVHVAAIVGAVWFWSWGGLALALGSYVVRMVIVTAAYHRYFSHRAFKTSRAFQFLLALGAQTAGQKGVIWWASHHRWHHKHSDTPKDVHSARLRGFWYSHIGWVLSSNWNETEPALVQDLLRYPELRFLNQGNMEVVPMVLFGAAFLWLGGVHAFIWGFLISSVLVWHGSFSVNSLAHLIGRRRYATSDDSRNSFLLAVATMGEGWHNNHHHYPSAVRQGFRWWEIDLTYYVLWVLARLGIVWDLRHPSATVLAGPLAGGPFAPASPVGAVDSGPGSGTLHEA